MQVQELDANLWSIRQPGESADAACCYDSREAAIRALGLPAAEKWRLQRMADMRAGAPGVITFADVVAALAARNG